MMFLTITLGYSCKTNDSKLNIRVNDTDTAFIYDAVYPVSKTKKLEDYISKQLGKALPVDQKVDATVNLISGELFKIKATEGALSIQFDKRNSSVTNFINIKNFTDGISEILSEK